MVGQLQVRNGSGGARTPFNSTWQNHIAAAGMPTSINRSLRTHHYETHPADLPKATNRWMMEADAHAGIIWLYEL